MNRDIQETVGIFMQGFSEALYKQMFEKIQTELADPMNKNFIEMDQSMQSLIEAFHHITDAQKHMAMIQKKLQKMINDLEDNMDKRLKALEDA